MKARVAQARRYLATGICLCVCVFVSGETSCVYVYAMCMHQRNRRRFFATQVSRLTANENEGEEREENQRGEARKVLTRVASHYEKSLRASSNSQDTMRLFGSPSVLLRKIANNTATRTMRKIRRRVDDMLREVNDAHGDALTASMVEIFEPLRAKIM